MLALRDEVEQEYADRMDDLRNMYRDEMNAQTESFGSEKKRLQSLESSLQESLKTKRKEVDELRARATGSESKCDELTVRLENQTLEVLRLQTELEEMEYEDANE
jgi:chromosome segregation ATPase